MDYRNYLLTDNNVYVKLDLNCEYPVLFLDGRTNRDYYEYPSAEIVRFALRLNQVENAKYLTHKVVLGVTYFIVEMDDNVHYYNFIRINGTIALVAEDMVLLQLLDDPIEPYPDLWKTYLQRAVRCSERYTRGKKYDDTDCKQYFSTFNKKYMRDLRNKYQKDQHDLEFLKHYTCESAFYIWMYHLFGHETSVV